MEELDKELQIFEEIEPKRGVDEETKAKKVNSHEFLEKSGGGRITSEMQRKEDVNKIELLDGSFGEIKGGERLNKISLPPIRQFDKPQLKKYESEDNEVGLQSSSPSLLQDLQKSPEKSTTKIKSQMAQNPTGQLKPPQIPKNSQTEANESKRNSIAQRKTPNQADDDLKKKILEVEVRPSFSAQVGALITKEWLYTKKYIKSDITELVIILILAYLTKFHPAPAYFAMFMIGTSPATAALDAFMMDRVKKFRVSFKLMGMLETAYIISYPLYYLLKAVLYSSMFFAVAYYSTKDAALKITAESIKASQSNPEPEKGLIVPHFINAECFAYSFLLLVAFIINKILQAYTLTLFFNDAKSGRAVSSMVMALISIVTLMPALRSIYNQNEEDGVGFLQVFSFCFPQGAFRFIYFKYYYIAMENDGLTQPPPDSNGSGSGGNGANSTLSEGGEAGAATSPFGSGPSMNVSKVTLGRDWSLFYIFLVQFLAYLLLSFIMTLYFPPTENGVKVSVCRKRRKKALNKLAEQSSIRRKTQKKQPKGLNESNSESKTINLSFKSIDEDALNPKDPSQSNHKKDPLEAKEEEQVLLDIQKVQKRFKKFKALDSVSLKIYTNKVTCILGHNGAGKTTLINCICGVNPPTSGQIFFQNEDVYSSSDVLSGRVGYCTAHDNLYEDITLIQYLTFIANIKGVVNPKPHLEALMEYCQLSGFRDQVGTKLSGGTKRRVSIASALIGNPRLLIMDEPSSGIDPKNRRKLWDLIKMMTTEDRGIILTTHHLEEAEYLSQDVVILDKGNVNIRGTPLEIRAKYGVGYKILVSGLTGEAALEALNNFYSRLIHNFGNKVEGMSLGEKSPDGPKAGSGLLGEDDLSLKPKNSSNLRNREKSENLLIAGSKFSFGGEYKLESQQEQEDSLLVDKKKPSEEKTLIDSVRSIFRVDDSKLKLFGQIELVVPLKLKSRMSKVVKILESSFSKFTKNQTKILENQKPAPQSHQNQHSLVRFGIESNSLEDAFINLGLKNSQKKYTKETLKELFSQSSHPTAFKTWSALIKRRLLILFKSVMKTLNFIFLTIFPGMISWAQSSTGKLEPVNFAIFSFTLIFFYGTGCTFFSEIPFFERKERIRYYLKVVGIRGRVYFGAMYLIDIVLMAVMILLSYGFLVLFFYGNYDFGKDGFPAQQVFLMISLLYVWGLTFITQNYCGQFFLSKTKRGAIYMLNYYLLAWHLIATIVLIIPTAITIFLGRDRSWLIFTAIAGFTSVTPFFPVLFVLILMMGKEAQKLGEDSNNNNPNKIELPEVPVYALTAIYVGCVLSSFLYLAVSVLLDSWQNSVKAPTLKQELDVPKVRAAMKERKEKEKEEKLKKEKELQKEKEKDKEKKETDKEKREEAEEHVGLKNSNEGSDPRDDELRLTRNEGKEEKQEPKDQKEGEMGGREDDKKKETILQKDQTIKKGENKDIGVSETSSKDDRKQPIDQKALLDQSLTQEQKESILAKYRSGIEANNQIADQPNPVLPIQIQRVSKIFKNAKKQKFLALDTVSLYLQPGENLGLLGPNGAGKSTLFNLLSTYHSQDSGKILVYGQELKNQHKFFKKVGLCTQENLLWETLTVEDHINIFSSIKGIPKKKALKWLEIYSLDNFEATKTVNLSSGMKRKLCFILSAMSNPKFKLLDEVSSGMDPLARDHLKEFISSQKRLNGGTCIITTHTMEEAEKICDRIVIMVNGKLALVDSVDGLKNSLGAYKLEIRRIEGSDKDDSALKQKLETCLFGKGRSWGNGLGGEGGEKERLTEISKGLDFVVYEFDLENGAEGGLKLSGIFERLQGLVDEGLVKDFSLSRKSLSDVFLSLCQLQESKEEEKSNKKKKKSKTEQRR